LPTYEYRCDSCAKNFDVVQSFQDDALTSCPTCGSPVRKVFGNVGIVFKGSGFYKTDSRSGAPKKEGTGDGVAATNGSEGPGNEGADSTLTAANGDAAPKTPATDSSSSPASPASPGLSSGQAKPGNGAKTNAGTSS
jgi:putative FmdB family regulatory protein